MEKFKIFNDINKKQKYKNQLVIISLLVTCLVSISSGFFIYKTNESVKNNFYVLDNGQKLSVVRVGDLKKAIDILCEGHIKNFHMLFFNLGYDLTFIKKNIETKALYMIDNSGHKLYNELQESGYYKSIVIGKYTAQVEEDSLIIDYSKYPFKFIFYGKQKLEKNGEISYRNLKTQGYVRETLVTPNNLNGIIISNYKVIDNSDLN